ncbi:hypothetical protein ACPPVO_33350 [Dactylosporangium sp. McL0621]|uniref:hypothetical protein n=1 Tax=Dactylosporangium sp. McL0621 TaxID=3415678 RepID=UPI003CF2A459
MAFAITGVTSAFATGGELRRGARPSDRTARGEAAAGRLSEYERAEVARLRRENAELAMVS